jgi:hypothetical protein
MAGVIFLDSCALVAHNTITLMGITYWGDNDDDDNGGDNGGDNSSDNGGDNGGDNGNTQSCVYLLGNSSLEVTRTAVLHVVADQRHPLKPSNVWIYVPESSSSLSSSSSWSSPSLSPSLPSSSWSFSSSSSSSLSLRSTLSYVRNDGTIALPGMEGLAVWNTVFNQSADAVVSLAIGLEAAEWYLPALTLVNTVAHVEGAFLSLSLDPSVKVLALARARG